jgi:hypothetical protein
VFKEVGGVFLFESCDKPEPKKKSKKESDEEKEKEEKL